MNKIINTIAATLMLFPVIQAQQPTCHTIVLDLSDRILVEGQIRKDIDVIQHIFNAFESKVRKELYIKSKDIFQVLIIPQRGSQLDIAKYEKDLRIDVGHLQISERAKRVKSAHTLLKYTLAFLYDDAEYSDLPSDYSGVDIWQFFNVRLEYHLPKDVLNKVYVLTDGYMDFETYGHQIVKGNRYTSTRFLSKIRNPKWRTLAQQKDYGFLPINTKLPISEIKIIGMTSKVHDLNEMERLKYFWGDWFKSMNIKQTRYYPSVSGDIINL